MCIRDRVSTQSTWEERTDLQTNESTGETKCIGIAHLKTFLILVHTFRKEIIAFAENLRPDALKAAVEEVRVRVKEALLKSPRADDGVNADGRAKLVREILFLAKTFRPVEKERVNVFAGKSKQLEILVEAKDRLTDPKIVKNASKQKDVVDRYVEQFPYLKIFSSKNDVKFLVPCMIKIIEAKLAKSKKYQDGAKSSVARLGIIEKAITNYDKK
eukprot:TRINITY_DN22543_c0_g2_i1.p1 TRINITY_DN22543_c0_g2~~TRINITY_DN22543_c0_g2_i1.p1  ORF type:complete len:215 (-),score=51.15 TRINITY_DN22543_c0_g2_i1:175-819(-)